MQRADALLRGIHDGIVVAMNARSYAYDAAFKVLTYQVMAALPAAQLCCSLALPLGSASQGQLQQKMRENKHARALVK